MADAAPAPGDSSLYGFVVHPLAPLHLAVQRIWRLGRGAGPLKRFPTVVTSSGKSLQGLIYGIPLLPGRMIEDQEAAVAAIRSGVRELAERGAASVGLGALCAMVGSRGRAVAADSPVPVTTGHHLTAWAAGRTLDLALEARGKGVGEPVLVIGAPGPVAVAAAEVIARSGRPVRLAGGARVGALASVLARTPGIEWVPREGATRGAGVVVSASSGGGALDEAELDAGALVIDVGRPRDLAGRRRRDDIMVVDGEMVALPPRARLDTITRVYGALVGHADTHVFACFAAPMVLAATGVPQEVPARRFLDPEDVERLGGLAEQQGFFVDRLYDRGRPVSIPGV
jgi:predicted amino acid dehydrogenase